MHKRRSIAICLVLLTVRVTPAEPPRFQATDFPRVASSTAYQPLVMGMVGDFAGVPVKEGFPNQAGERFWVPMQNKHPAWLALDAGGMTLLDRVRSPKTHEAAVWIIQGQAELALVPRPGPEVLAEAARQGVRLMATPVARDGLIFLAHAGNPVRNATRERLRALYAGESMAWQDLDPSGAPLPIDPLVRNTTSGSHVLLRALLMGETPVSNRLGSSQIVQGMGSLLDRVGREPAALGYSIFTYHRGMARVDPSERPTKGSYARVPTQVLAVDGVEPTAESIAEGRYPLIADVVLLHRADLPPEGPAARLRDWLAGAEGQAWILGRGFVPLQVAPSPPGP